MLVGEINKFKQFCKKNNVKGISYKEYKDVYLGLEKRLKKYSDLQYKISKKYLEEALANNNLKLIYANFAKIQIYLNLKNN